MCPDAVQVGLGRVDKDAATLWITRAAALAHAAYVDACFAAELRVRPGCSARGEASTLLWHEGRALA